MTYGQPPRIPTSAMQYGHAPLAVASGRTGILTAVGVISICLGAVGLVVNVFFIFVTGAIFSIAPRHAVNATSVITPPPAHSAVTEEYVAEYGLPSAERQILIDGLCQVHPMSDARRQRVDALLADAGKKIFHFSAATLTAERVAANVTSYSSMPRATDGDADDVYILGTGRLQVSDDTAVFFASGNPAGIRSEGGSFKDSTGSHLAAVQINAVIQQVQSKCNNAMNAIQLKTFQDQLAEPNQRIINPSDSVAGAVAQVHTPQVLPDGTVGITTDGNSLSFGPNGEVVPGITSASGGGPNAPMQFVKRSGAGFVFLESILSLCAAGFLLTCGILVMKNSPSGRRFHLIYAIGKILLGVLLAAAGWSMLSTVQESQSGIEFIVTVAIMGIIYPIVLLVVMNTRGIREYYKAPVVNRLY